MNIVPPGRVVPVVQPEDKALAFELEEHVWLLDAPWLVFVSCQPEPRTGKQPRISLVVGVTHNCIHSNDEVRDVLLKMKEELGEAWEAVDLHVVSRRGSVR